MAEPPSAPDRKWLALLAVIFLALGMLGVK